MKTYQKMMPNSLIDNKSLTLRVLGPNGKPYIETKNQFEKEFRDEGFYFSVPVLLSAPLETTVIVTTGIGVVTGVSTYLITSLIEKIFKIKKSKEQNNTTVNFNIQIGDKYIDMPNDKKEMLKKIDEIRNKQKNIAPK